jgi:multiple sugar transport system permease protein
MTATSDHDGAMLPDRAGALPAGQGQAARVRSRATVRRRLRTVPAHTLLIAVSVPFMLPLFWLATGTFKPVGELLQVPPVWIPSHWTLDNVRSLFSYSDVNIPYYAANTAYICAFNVVATVASCSLVAYGFARIRFPGRDVLFAIMIGTLILPSWATLIPTYMIFKWLGWLGTFRPLTWPALFGDAFTIFLMRQFMRGIPMELSEAAYIDGANEFGIFWRVIVPLIKPVLAVAALFTFIYNYNDFFGPLIYLTDSGKYTLALAAFEFVRTHGAPDIGAVVAFSTLVTLPLIVLFFFTQRMLVEGVTLTGIRG